MKTIKPLVLLSSFLKKIIVLILSMYFVLFEISAQTQLGSDIDGEAVDDWFGWSVSLSSDGSTLAAGAPHNNGNGFKSGHVRVYQRSGNNWIQIGEDIDGEAQRDESGYSVSLNSDGTIIAIGANRNQGNGTASGHVRVYQFLNGNWTQIGSDIDGEAEGDLSGHSISLNSDGTILAIGAISNNDNGNNDNNSGHIRVYQFSGGNWTQMGSDIDGESFSDSFGRSVSLSSDGLTLAGGAINPFNNTDTGYVKVYNFSGGDWIQIGSNINGEAPGDLFGHSVDLNSDGTILAIGAPSPFNSPETGYVKLYNFSGNNWNQIGEKINGENEGDQFGFSVSLSSDGSILAAGATRNDVNSVVDVGHVRLYQFSEDNWIQIGEDIDGEGAVFEQSGCSVSLNSAGSIVAIGAFNNNGNGISSGNVRIYNLDGILNVDTTIFESLSLYPNPAKEYVKLYNPKSLSLDELAIYDMKGCLVYNFNLKSMGKERTIDISKLASNTSYLFSIQGTQGVVIKKLIKE